MLKITKFEEKEGQEYLNNGLILVNKNKPEYGSIMVKSQPIVDKNSLNSGFINASVRTAFYVGGVETLKSFDFKEGDNLDEIFGEELTIIRLESIEEKEGYRPLINPTTKEQISSKDGEPIYWTTRVSLKALEEKDVLVERASNPVSHINEEAFKKQQQEA